jgi:hypothetical protein
MSKHTFSVRHVDDFLGSCLNEIEEDKKKIDSLSYDDILDNDKQACEQIVFKPSGLVSICHNKPVEKSIQHQLSSDEFERQTEYEIERDILEKINLLLVPNRILPEAPLIVIGVEEYKNVMKISQTGRGHKKKVCLAGISIKKELHASILCLGLKNINNIKYIKFDVLLENKYCYTLEMSEYIVSKINDAVHAVIEKELVMLKLEQSIENNLVSTDIFNNANRKIKEIQVCISNINAYESDRAKEQKNANFLITDEKKKSGNSNGEMTPDLIRCGQKKLDSFEKVRKIKRFIKSDAKIILQLFKDVKIYVIQLIRNWINDNFNIIKESCYKHSFFTNSDCIFEDNHVGEVFLSQIGFDIVMSMDIADALPCWFDDDDCKIDKDDEDDNVVIMLKQMKWLGVNTMSAEAWMNKRESWIK